MILKYFVHGNYHSVNQYLLKKYCGKSGKIIAAPVTEWCKKEKDTRQYLYDLENLNNTLQGQEIAIKPSSFNFEYEKIEPLLKNNSKNIFNFDAEESWTKADYHLLMDKVIKNNKFLVRKCYQAYLKEEFDVLLNDLKKYNNEYSIRLVRGAYQQLEIEKGTNAVFDNKGETDDQFRDMMKYLIFSTENKVMIATHNNEDVLFVKNIIKYHNEIDIINRVKIGQLMGMNYGGEQIVEYVPYGNLRDAIPYLSRRLIENKSMLRYLL